MNPLESMSDDPSFVILGQGSISHSMDRFEHEISSINSSGGSVMVQQKLDLLLRENNELKNALLQNNLAMKAQFETLAKWQQDVVSTHKSHKEKFAETRELVLKLKAENAILKRQLVEPSENAPSKGLDTEFLFKKIERLTAENQNLVKERDELEENCRIYLQQMKELKVNLTSKCEELDILKSNYSSLAHKVDTTDSIDDRLAASVVKSQATENRKRVISENSMPSWVCVEDIGKQGVEALTSELKKVETDLENEKLSHIIVKKDYDDLKLKFNLSCEENSELKLQLKEAKEDGGVLQKTKEQLKTKNDLLEQALAALDAEREKNKELQKTCDEMALLKAQAEVYQMDYKEEREAREKVVEEREKMAEELRLLRSKLAELQGHREADAAQPSAPQRETSPVQVAAASIPDVAQNPVADPADPVIAVEEELESFCCFKCNKSCRTLNQLQNHVEECLQLS